MTTRACRWFWRSCGRFPLPAMLADFNAPPPTRQQIEADWLPRTRSASPPPRRPRQSYTREERRWRGWREDGKWVSTRERVRPVVAGGLAAAHEARTRCTVNRCDGAWRAQLSHPGVGVRQEGRSSASLSARRHGVYGQTDNKPLSISLNAPRPRFVRLR